MNGKQEQIIELALDGDLLSIKCVVEQLKSITKQRDDLLAEREQLVAKAGEVMRERCFAAFNQPHVEWFGDQIEEEIRALPGVTLEDLK